jgi:hypothetical protein
MNLSKISLPVRNQDPFEKFIRGIVKDLRKKGFALAEFDFVEDYNEAKRRIGRQMPISAHKKVEGQTAYVTFIARKWR